MIDRRLPRSVSSLRNIILGSLLVSAGAFADTVEIGGTVASTVSITSTATAGATTLDLGGLGVTIGEKIVKVADLAMTTNNSTGLALSIDSGNLVNGAATVAFKVQTVADEALAPATGDFSVASGTPNAGFTTGAAGAAARDLYIAYTPADVLDPGSYVATITLTISDN